MSQQLVDFVQVTQLLRDVLQSLEPALVSALSEELLPLQLHQVAALVSARRLPNRVSTINKVL